MGEAFCGQDCYYDAVRRCFQWRSNAVLVEMLQWFRMVEHVTTRVGSHHISTETFVLVSYSAVWYKLSCVIMTYAICQPKNLP